MIRLFRLILGLWLLTSVVISAQAAFSSLYVFGDTLSSTADPSAPGPPYFYGQRDSNGRVWVEVLAQRQGLNFDNAKNSSYWDHNSGTLVAELASFTPPKDIANDLFVVWVCNADTFDAAQVPDTFAQWQAANVQSQANHLQIILNLYAKGVRTLVMPNAVDISKIPAFNAGIKYTGIESAGCADYNARFAKMISQARAQCPGLTIYTPDFFTLLNNVLANPAYYGLTNALSPKGFSIDALSDPSIANLTLNGQGTNYIFWDPQDPTAQFHEVIADVAQQIISPVNFSKLAVLNGSNRLDVVNVPLGLNGFLEGSTNLTSGSWTVVTNWSSTSLTQSIFVNSPVLPPSTPAGGGDSGGVISIDPNNPSQGGTYIPPVNPAMFYRLRLPYYWSWP